MSKFRQILSETQVGVIIDDMAREVEARAGTYPIAMVPILTGGMWTAVMLSRALKNPAALTGVYPVVVSSYGWGTSGGSVEVKYADFYCRNLHDTAVVVVDDIFERGYTLLEATNYIRKLYPDMEEPKILTATLLRKIKNYDRSCPVPDVIGHTIESGWVVGCGMDWHGAFRGKTDIGIVDEL